MIPHFIYLREGTKFANILASAWHASRSGHLLVVEGAPALLLPLEGSLVLHELPTAPPSRFPVAQLQNLPGGAFATRVGAFISALEY